MSKYDMRNLLAKIKKLEHDLQKKEKENKRLSDLVKEWIVDKKPLEKRN